MVLTFSVIYRRLNSTYEIIVPSIENNEISTSNTNFVGQCRSRKRQGKLLLRRWNPTVTRSFETISLGKFVVFSTATAGIN